MSQPRFEPSTSRTQIRSITATSTCSVNSLQSLCYSPADRQWNEWRFLGHTVEKLIFPTCPTKPRFEFLIMQQPLLQSLLVSLLKSPIHFSRHDIRVEGYKFTTLLFLCTRVSPADGPRTISGPRKCQVVRLHLQGPRSFIYAQLNVWFGWKNLYIIFKVMCVWNCSHFTLTSIKILKIFRLILGRSAKENPRNKWSTVQKHLGIPPINILM
jgi:hypothetical protein